MTKSQRMTIKLAIVGGAIGIAVWLMFARTFITPVDAPLDLNPAAPQRCIGIFIVCIALWLTNLIPPAATGLLAIALLPVLDVLPEKEAFALFGNTAVFFMLGVFLLAGATISTGLSKRVTLMALHRFDQSPERLAMGVMVSAAFLSLWMPEHAVAAMIYPIIVEIVDILNLKQGSAYAKKLFLALAWGAVIGGVGTFLGGARAPLALSLLQEAYPDTRITFVQWMLAAIPIVILMVGIGLIVLRYRIQSDITSIKEATQMLDRRVEQIGAMSSVECRLAGLGIVTIAAWIVLGHTIGLSVIAIFSASLLFVLRIVDWRSVQNYVNWGVLVMYGGAIALGHALSETQALAWMVDQFIDPTTPRMLVLFVMIGAAMLLTEGISNSAAVAILLPIGYSLCATIGIDPITMTLAVTIPAGLTFLLPVSSPPNAISYSAGHYSMREVIQIGWPMTVSAYIVILLVVMGWWQFVLGMNIW